MCVTADNVYLLCSLLMHLSILFACARVYVHLFVCVHACALFSIRV